MSILRSSFFIIGVLFFFSCSEESVGNGNQYFSINDVLNEQERILNKINPSILKTVSINESLEEKVLVNTNWKNELSYFHQFELNKTQYKDDCKEKKNETYLEYLFSENENIKKYIVKKDSFDRVEEITIEVENSNIFYSSVRQIKLKFGLYSTTFPLLESYKITSERKVLFLEDEKVVVNTIIKK